MRRWTRGLGCWINGWVAGLIWDDRLDHDLRLERARVDVGVSDSQLPGYQGSAFIPKVPVEGDVCVAEVLAGVVEGDGEGYCPVLDKAHVPRHDVVNLVQGDSEGDLIWAEHQEMTSTKGIFYLSQSYLYY